MKKRAHSVVLEEGQSASLQAGGVGERRAWGSGTGLAGDNRGEWGIGKVSHSREQEVSAHTAGLPSSPEDSQHNSINRYSTDISPVNLNCVNAGNLILMFLQ